MSEYKDITIESEENSGKIVFAEDVVATIATLAAAEVDGVYGMSGTAFEGIGEKLGKKNYTKGIKVEVGSVECAVDMSIIVRYGFRIQEVCRNVQVAVKNAIETMTGLKVVQVNIAVNSIVFAKELPVEQPKPENRVK
ncbi:MAG: Asp23/Gls24 family envelope stress response protein [Clostridia bacterium]|nr:Asp23/Gls24 family envelope stress response protein [Clostridia bacterium]